eukprot:tig00020960_g16600.t1
MPRGTAAVILLLSVFLNVSAFPMYLSLIPNGILVKRGGLPWIGVGHENALGGGPRNVFGEDFARAGHKWTKELCEKDSDGDGYSNGWELGDPCCVWNPFVLPERMFDISHPGFADRAR